MGCGCKEKKVIAPAQQPSRITYTENGTVPVPSPLAPPAPIPPPLYEVENIVDKLNDIQR